MSERPPRARMSASRLLAIASAAMLAACESSPPAGTATTLEPGHGRWRVIERTGAATATSREAGRPLTVIDGVTLPAATKLATGSASQLIVAAAGTQATLGPRSRIGLPDKGSRELLAHDRGLVRYRVVRAPTLPLRIVTPTGSAETADGMVEVDVPEALDRTVFSAIAGDVRVTTRDGARGVTLRAGQSAEVRASGERLAFRRAPDAPLEPVVPVILPAAAPSLDAAVGSGSVSPVPTAPAGARSESRAGAVATVVAARSQLSDMPDILLAAAVAELAAEAGAEAPAEALVRASPPSARMPGAPKPEGGAGPGFGSSVSNPTVPEPISDTVPLVVDRVVVPARFKASDRPAVVGPDDTTEAGSAPTAGRSMSDEPQPDEFDLMTRGLLEGLAAEASPAPMIAAP
jgi:hypothetical protein